MQKSYSVADRLEGRLAAGTGINLLPESAHTVRDYSISSLQHPIPYSVDFAGNSIKQVIDVRVDYGSGVLIASGGSALDIQKSAHTSQIALRPHAVIYRSPVDGVEVLYMADSIFSLGGDYPFDGMFEKKQVFSDAKRRYLTEMYAPINFQHFPENVLAKIREGDIINNPLIIWLGTGTSGSRPSETLDTAAFISANGLDSNNLGVLILKSRTSSMQKP